MNDYYFTFGAGHYNYDGKPLGNCYTIITAPSEELARGLMCSKRGRKWSSNYLTAEDAGVVKYNLTAVPFSEIGHQPIDLPIEDTPHYFYE